MTLLCCCNPHRMTPGISSPPSQDVALQPIPSSTSPTGQGQADSELRHQPSLIGLSDTPWAIPNHQGSYDNGSIIHHPLDDDSDSDQDQPHATKKGGSAFDAVRNKLIRTMSHDSSTKNPSLTSLGNSDEEIARRAELRRLMHRRIQDELQTEQPDDDMENKPPHGIRCIASIVNLGLPSAGPRDAIEFAVNKSPSLDARVPRSGKDQSHERDAPEPQYVTDDQKKMSLDRNSPTEGDNKAEKDGDKGDGTGIAINLPSQTPRSGHIEQAHSQKSFQLSNSATHLDRILGPDNSFNSRHASSSGDGHSALGVWLIAQGLRSRDNSALHFDDDEEEEETGSGIDNSQVISQSEPTETAKKEPISDSQNILSKEETLPANEVSVATGTLDRTEPSGDLNSERCKMNPHSDIGSRRTGHTSSPLSGQRTGAPTVATARNSLADNSSSCYPSKFQPSPARSRQNLYSLDLKELEGMELSPFKWQAKSSQDQESAEKQQQNSINDDGTQSKEIGVVHGCQGQNPSQAAPDTASRSQSECASFLQLEAELGTIERRFGDLLARKTSKSQYKSRFREEFNEPSLGQPVRKSFMSKIHLTVPIRFKVSSRSLGDHDEGNAPGLSREPSPTLGLPDTTIGHKKRASDRRKKLSNLSIRSHMSPLSSEIFQKPHVERQESATDLWQRAIRLEAEERHSGSNRLSTPNPDHQRNASSNRSLRVTGTPQKRVSKESLSTENTQRETSQLTPTTDEVSGEHNSKWLIQRWVAQMRPGTPHTTEGAESLVSLNLESPPRSWARFPSHNREERNKNASAKDNVYPRDFAIKLVSSEGQVYWATDLVPDEEKQRAQTLPRSFSARLGQVVKSKIVKLIPSRHFQPEKGQAPVKVRVISQTAHLEYPELEIQPTESGYEELRVLEREINNMKGENRLSTPDGEASRPRSTKSLGDRISALMHEAAMEEHHGHGDDLALGETPVTPSLLQESIVATDVFLTPESRFSYASNSQQGKSGSDTGSAEIREHEALKAFIETDQRAHRSRSITWVGRPLAELRLMQRHSGDATGRLYQNETKSMSMRPQSR